MRRVRRAAAVMTTAMTLAGCGSSTPGVHLSDVPDACGLVSDAAVTTAFGNSVADPGRVLARDAVSSACLVNVHTGGDTVPVTVSVAANGSAALQHACSGAAPISGLGDGACWNATQISVSVLKHGVLYTVGVPISGFAQDYQHNVLSLATFIAKFH